MKLISWFTHTHTHTNYRYNSLFSCLVLHTYTKTAILTQQLRLKIISSSIRIYIAPLSISSGAASQSMDVFMCGFITQNKCNTVKITKNVGKYGQMQCRTAWNLKTQYFLATSTLQKVLEPCTILPSLLSSSLFLSLLLLIIINHYLSLLLFLSLLFFYHCYYYYHYFYYHFIIIIIYFHYYFCYYYYLFLLFIIIIYYY